MNTWYDETNQIRGVGHVHTVYVVFDRTEQTVYEKKHSCSQEAIKDYCLHCFKLKDNGFTTYIQTEKLLTII